MNPLSVPTLEAAVREIEERGWVDNSGPWVDAMDLALRRFELRHQFAIVGYGLGNTYDADHRRGWSDLLTRVNERAEPLPVIDVGQRRMIRPASVLPGGVYARTGRRRRR